MKKETIELNVLEVEDVERLVSEAAGREVKVGDIEMTLIDVVPEDVKFDGHGGGTYIACGIRVDDEEILDEDSRSPLDDYLPNIAYLYDEQIFDFDVSLFKSYDRYTDPSD